jgi:bifunctional DNA-binding transcriptional regulator/antitoxin component of YhaV-PrlF toxin-antitoxin module
LAEIKRVDSQGRISLPARWRSKKLQGNGEVIVIEKGDVLLVKPRVKPDLTKHFDSVEVDIGSEDFADYSRLKKAVLARRGK